MPKILLAFDKYFLCEKMSLIFLLQPLPLHHEKHTGVKIHNNLVNAFCDKLFSQNKPVDPQAFVTPAMNTRRYVCVMTVGTNT